jgi:sugar lactone lactonase YvrE
MRKNLTFLFVFVFIAMRLTAQPVISIPPASQVVLANSTNTIFNVQIAGPGLINYQWLHDGTNLPNDVITTIAGKYTGAYLLGDNGPATNASLKNPAAIALDHWGNIFIADTSLNRIRKVDTNGIITTVAGSNVPGFYGDGGAATNARLNAPAGVALDNLGNIFIADLNNSRIRKVDTNGIITTYAGNGVSGFAGDGGPATNAEIKGGLGSPYGLCLDSTGNLYLADTGNGRIRKVDTNGIITTVVSNLFSPANVIVDGLGNIFIAEFSYGHVRKLDTNGILTDVAGGGSSLADGVPATNAQITPFGLCVNTNGNLFIGDITANHRGVRKVDTNGIITTVVGNGSLVGSSGDGGLAINAVVLCPYGLGFDPYGNLIVSDQAVSVIRKVWFSGWPSLALSPLHPSSPGDYQVIVTDSSGSVTSSVANLSVAYPSASSHFYTNNGYNNFVINWPVFQPSVFQVQWTTNLSAGAWSNIGSPVVYSGTTTNVFGTIDSSWTNYPQGFYRVQWLQ